MAKQQKHHERTMAEDQLYSIEAVIDALTRAGAASAHAQDETEIIRATLLPLMELLEAKCGIFYPAVNSAYVSHSPIRIHSAATGEPHMPAQLPPEMEEFIFESLQQVATSQDPAFTRQHLKKLPATTAASSSIWAGVSAGETRFGIVALFDPATRNFGGVEQKLVRTFCLQMGNGLASLQSRDKRTAHAPSKEPDNVVDGYIEFARIMNGVSRELINPITAVLGYIELLKSEQQSAQSVHYLTKIQEQTEKTQGIVSALTSSPQARNLRPLSAMTSQPAGAAAPVTPIRGEVSAATPAAPQPHSKILLVQKSEAVMEFQKSVLATVGAEAICTFAGWEAVSILKNNEVDAVILDDEIEGEWPASKIFAWICDQKPELAQKVLLTISPKPTPEIREWVDGCGIPSVTKPLHIVKLYAGVQRILGVGAAPSSKLLH